MKIRHGIRVKLIPARNSLDAHPKKPNAMGDAGTCWMPLNAFYCNCLVGTSSTFAQIIQIVLKPQPQAEKISPEMEYPLN